MPPEPTPHPHRSPDARIVLFVDDEPQACKWFARLFGDEFTILTAGSASQALQALGERGADIAVLLTDYRMPGRDGLALLEEVQHAHRQVVRLLATAYADKDMALAAINQGRVMRILEKPFDGSQVRAALREALGMQRQREREQARLEGRAAAMRETLGFLAHELNTPLATVLGYLEALRSGHEAPAPTSPSAPDAAPGPAPAGRQRAGDTLAMLQAAERRTLYALSLLATFVASARNAYPGSAPAPLPASGLVRALLDEYPFEGNERAWVTCDLAADFMLPGQQGLLYLVLCTLTKNALQALRGHASPGLHITLEHCAQDAGGPARAAMRFADTGPGIDPAILARLTREPVTTRAGEGGSGMGLLFCQRVLESMGGLIDISSRPGGGASVVLFFASDISLDSLDSLTSPGKGLHHDPRQNPFR